MGRSGYSMIADGSKCLVWTTKMIIKAVRMRAAHLSFSCLAIRMSASSSLELRSFLRELSCFSRSRLASLARMLDSISALNSFNYSVFFSEAMAF